MQSSSNISHRCDSRSTFPGNFAIAFQPSCRNFVRFLSCLKTETFRLGFQPVSNRLLTAALTGPLIASFAISPSIIWLQCQCTFPLFWKCNATSCSHFRVNRSSLCFVLTVCAFANNMDARCSVLRTQLHHFFRFRLNLMVLF